MRTPPSSIASLILLGAMLSPAAHAAEKLKGFYSGSGGLSAQVHRVLIIEFAADGTALLQQQWHEKDPQTWHARWQQDGKKVIVTYVQPKDSVQTKDPAQSKDAPPLPEPLIFTFNHGTLTATSWDTPTLGALGPPKLTPFGGKNPQVGSVASCQSLNSLDPQRDCVTWGSNR